MEASDGSPRETTTSGSAPAPEVLQLPTGPTPDLGSRRDEQTAPADRQSPAQDADLGDPLHRLSTQFPNGLTEAETPKSQTAISSLINPVFTLEELYPTGPLDNTGGTGFEPSHGGMASGRVQHWLEKTPSLPSGGPLTGLHQNNIGDVVSNHNNSITALLKYRCLEPLLPHLTGILSVEDASEMLEIYFNEQRTSLFKSTSPYSLTHILHASSVLHPTEPRPTSPTLLVVILFCVAQTADMNIFDPPGARQRIIVDLYRLSLDLIQPDDADNYFRTSGRLNGTSILTLAM